MKVVEFSENNALDSAAVATLGADKMNTHVVISFNNTEHHRAHRLGGPSKTVRLPLLQSKLEHIMERRRGIRYKIVLELAKSGALEAARDHFTGRTDNEEPSPHSTFIGSAQEGKAYYNRQKETRTRAPMVQTTDKVLA